MSLAAQLVIAIALAVAGFAGGIKWQVGVVAQRDLAAQASAAKVRAKQLDRVDAAAVAYEADKAQIRTEYLTITQEVERVVEKPIYRDGVCFDDDGLRLIRAATGAAAPPGQPAPAVP